VWGRSGIEDGGMEVVRMQESEEREGRKSRKREL
jgi:hypothetical protein